MKRWVSTLAVCMTAAMLAGCGAGSDTKVAVDSVGNITGLGNVGVLSQIRRFGRYQVEIRKREGSCSRFSAEAR